MPKKSSYGVKVGEGMVFVANNRLEHLLPAGPELLAIVGTPHWEETGNKSRARLSAEKARSVFRDFWRMLIDDLLEKPISFFFPVPGMVLRIEDMADIHEYDVKRHDLRFRYRKDENGQTQRDSVFRSPKQAYLYQPVLRFFLTEGQGPTWLFQNYLFRFILSRPYRIRLHRNVERGKRYFQSSV